MGQLDVFDLYHRSDGSQIERFNNKINSTMKVKTDYNKVECDYEWLEKMEATIQYLDNILRNPNRFIINEEDVVKIELARRITPESIKHLARNTNFIQDIKEDGSVQPSKILNINKEESFNTYENRFIYSLVKNMRYFLDRKKRDSIVESSFKNNKNIEYSASGKLGEEKVDVALTFNSKLDSKDDGNGANSINTRIAKLELQMADLTHSEVYKNLDKMHIALVTSPIKKTNVILKNVNFQYAVALWNYLQEHTDSSVKQVKDKKDYVETGQMKKYIDETIMLDYLVVDSINKQDKKAKIDTEEVSEKLVANMVEKLIDVNDSLSESQLKDIVSKQFTVIKYKAVANDAEIQKKFKQYLNEFIERVEEVKL
ncbi:MAG TPA: DUF2357 domain-containing protein [Bacilli bacterium]|nr:DUF2357 domain-containing protein [Bacilli bacterium]